MKPLSEKELIDMVTHYLRQESVAYGVRAEKIVHTFIQDRKAHEESIKNIIKMSDKYTFSDGTVFVRQRNQGEKTDD